jgi:hypothetical protein
MSSFIKICRLVLILQIVGDDTNKSAWHSWRNREQIKFREHLLLFSPKSFVFPSHIKNKDWNMQNCNFASCAVWVRNLVSHFEGGFLRTECWGGYLDLKGRKTDREENCVLMNFIACILHRIMLGWWNQGGWGGRDMWHAWGSDEVFTGFWLGG